MSRVTLRVRRKEKANESTENHARSVQREDNSAWAALLLYIYARRICIRIKTDVVTRRAAADNNNFVGQSTAAGKRVETSFSENSHEK